MNEKWREYEWGWAGGNMFRVFKIIGHPRVTWMSGEVTQESFASVVCVSDLELYHSVSGTGLLALRCGQCRQSAEDFISRTERTGYWIRHRKGRSKARRFASIEWKV